MFTWPTVTQQEGINPWVTYMLQRTQRKNNCINLVVTSMPGEGKSFSLLSQFSMIDPDFDVNEQCVFKAKKLIEYFKDGRTVKGKPILYDESEVDLDSANWQDVINKALGVFFSTARFRNYIFGMSCPFITMISKKVRQLMNCHWKAMGWNRDNLTKIKPFTLEYNPDVNNFYRKRLLIRTLKGGMSYCSYLMLPKPPEHLLKDYAKMKSEFTGDLYAGLLDKIEGKEREEQGSNRLKLSYNQENVLRSLLDGKLVPEIAAYKGCGERNIQAIMDAIRDKDIKIQGIKGKNNTTRAYEIDLRGKVL